MRRDVLPCRFERKTDPVSSLIHTLEIFSLAGALACGADQSAPVNQIMALGAQIDRFGIEHTPPVLTGTAS